MRSLLLGAVLALFVPLAQAQPISTADLDALFDSEPQVEVNLRGSLLRLAAAATREDEPEAAAMIDGLRSVTVRIYPAPETERGDALRSLETLAQRFEADAWFTLVRVRALPDGDEDDVWVYVRENGDAFEGMAVLAIDREDETATFVHIDGTIDPAQVSELSRRFARVDVDDSDEDDDE